jgi:hypothetical protein
MMMRRLGFLRMARAKAKSVKRRAPAKTSPRKLRARVHGSTLELLDPKPAALHEGAEVTVTVSELPRKPDLAALERSFGSWEGIVDTDTLLKNIYASRRMKSRRPVPRF